MDILEKIGTKVMQCILQVLSWRYLKPKTVAAYMLLLPLLRGPGVDPEGGHRGSQIFRIK